MSASKSHISREFHQLYYSSDKFGARERASLILNEKSTNINNKSTSLALSKITQNLDQLYEDQ